MSSRSTASTIAMKACSASPMPSCTARSSGRMSINSRPKEAVAHKRTEDVQLLAKRECSSGGVGGHRVQGAQPLRGCPGETAREFLRQRGAIVPGCHSAQSVTSVVVALPHTDLRCAVRLHPVWSVASEHQSSEVAHGRRVAQVIDCSLARLRCSEQVQSRGRLPTFHGIGEHVRRGRRSVVSRPKQQRWP